MLKAALSPTAVPLCKVQDVRGDLLVAPPDRRCQIDVPPRPPQERRFDEVVTQNSPASGGVPGNTGNWAWRTNGSTRRMALWPQ